MESLNECTWDVVISGTGLAQSFLALALSRCGKKVLHVDKNDYYGGPDAALSLQDAEDWVSKSKEDASFGPFESVSIHRSPESEGKLSYSRAYTLSLSPQLVYSKSDLLPSLVSSKVYRQLEFQAVGSWWVWHKTTGDDTVSLQRVPSSREDVFADPNMSMKSKRSLIKLLRLLQTHEEQEQGTTGEDLDKPFHEFIQSKLRVPAELHDPLMALSLTLKTWDQTSTSYAISRIKRHLESLGLFGPGFASMLMKWGGGAELAQVSCRACAVGGGVYALKRGVKDIETSKELSPNDPLGIELTDGEKVQSKFVVGSPWDLPSQYRQQGDSTTAKVAHSIMIVPSPLESLFPATSEGGPVSAGTVIVFSGHSISKGNDSNCPPVYLLIHSSDTGECPIGQCIIYGSTLLPSEEGYSAIESATQQLLASVDPEAEIIYTLRYTQLGSLQADASVSLSVGQCERVLSFPPPCLDLAFDDTMIEQVKRVWKMIMGDDADENEFLIFENREGTADE